MVGTVDADGTPFLLLTVAGRIWTAVIDTGFNGDLELPEDLRSSVNPRDNGYSHSLLAGGQSILEEVFLIDFPFDGQTVEADATFVPGQTILLGTHLLRRHRLEINFVAQTVLLERVA
jgi:predicted aspartyl protease